MSNTTVLLSLALASIAIAISANLFGYPIIHFIFMCMYILLLLILIWQQNKKHKALTEDLKAAEAEWRRLHDNQNT